MGLPESFRKFFIDKPVEIRSRQAGHPDMGDVTERSVEDTGGSKEQARQSGDPQAPI